MNRFFAAMLAVLAFAMLPAKADEVTFNKPKVGSFRVDWCYKYGIQCGDKAADRFCMSKGFDGAASFSKANDIGGDTPTKVMGTGQICDDETCDGFKFITCENSDEADIPDEPSFSDQSFDKPSLGGSRVHFCFKPGNGCGKKAADAFCDIVGYDKAIGFQQSTVLIGLKAPRFIGTGQVCSGLDCVGFKGITCRKEN